MEEEEVEQIDTSSLPEGTHIIQISTHDGQSEVVQLSMEEDAQVIDINMYFMDRCIMYESRLVYK